MHDYNNYKHGDIRRLGTELSMLLRLLDLVINFSSDIVINGETLLYRLDYESEQ